MSYNQEFYQEVNEGVVQRACEILTICRDVNEAKRENARQMLMEVNFRLIDDLIERSYYRERRRGEELYTRVDW